MTKRKHHSPEEIVRKLAKADRLAAAGKTAEEVSRDLEISTATYYAWQKRYGAMNVDEAKELRRLREENGKLKRIVADKELENLALREIASGNF